MTIEEAIEYIETRAKDLEFQGYDREAQAFNLGIEALKRERDSRKVGSLIIAPLLPGETEE